MAVFIKTVTVVPDGFEVAVDSELSTRRAQHDRKHIINFRVGVVALCVELFLQQFLGRVIYAI